MQNTHIIVKLRLVPARSEHSWIIPDAIEKTETKIILLKKAGFKTKRLMDGNRLSGLEVDLGEFSINSKKWFEIPEELTNCKKEIPEFFILCKEFGPDDKRNKVFCVADEENEVYEYGDNFAAYLTRERAIEVIVSIRGQLKINEYFIEFGHDDRLLRVALISIFEGKRKEYLKTLKANYRQTIFRGLENLEKEKSSQRETVKVMVNV